MNKNVLLEVQSEVGKDTTSPSDDFQELVALIEEMNIVEFEPLLDENLNSELEDSFLGKYHILAILRDLFMEYKAAGDTRISIEQGTCGHGCDKRCAIINLQGNNSKKNFAFGLDKSDAPIVNFHTCYGFLGKNKSKKLIDEDMMFNSLKKDAELKGKNTSGFNDGMKKILMDAIRVMYID